MNSKQGRENSRRQISPNDSKHIFTPLSSFSSSPIEDHTELACCKPRCPAECTPTSSWKEIVLIQIFDKCYFTYAILCYQVVSARTIHHYSTIVIFNIVEWLGNIRPITGMIRLLLHTKNMVNSTLCSLESKLNCKLPKKKHFKPIQDPFQHLKSTVRSACVVKICLLTAEQRNCR